MNLQMAFHSSENPVASSLERLGTVRHKAAGSVLFSRGDSAAGVFLIIQGRVELSLDIKNRSLLNRILGPGDIAGLPAAVSGEPYTLTATTTVDCELLFIPREAVLAALTDDPRFALALAEMLAHEVHHLREVWQDGYDRKAGPARR